MRRLRPMFVALLAGVCISVGIAWTSTGLGLTGLSRPAAARWPGPVPESWPGGTTSTRIAIASTKQQIGQSVYDVEMAHIPDRGKIHRFYRIEYGLPFRCLAIDFLRTTDRTRNPAVVSQPGISVIRSGLRLRQRGQPWPDQAFVLPIAPIWSGLVLNSLLFGSCLFLATRFVRRAIRRDRRRMKRCASCGYPLGAASVCSECGRVLPKRVAT